MLASFGPAGRATLIERPFRAITLLSAVSVALRSRRRQYEVRDLLARERAAAADLARKAAELEASNAELEQFAYVASHDLQEPLRMIGSYLQIIEKRYSAQFDDKATTSFGYVTDSAFALADALKNLEQRIVASGADVEVGTLPRVRADRVLLTQVFQNLIANALKFCEQKPVIRVSAQRDGESWAFSIADNGIGIPPDSAHRMFRIFQRVHSGARYRGTGIGLATCKKIVELQGGRIWFDSQEGAGSTFHFSLPDAER